MIIKTKETHNLSVELSREFGVCKPQHKTITHTRKCDSMTEKVFHFIHEYWHKPLRRATVRCVSVSLQSFLATHSSSYHHHRETKTLRESTANISLSVWVAANAEILKSSYVSKIRKQSSSSRKCKKTQDTWRFQSFSLVIRQLISHVNKVRHELILTLTHTRTDKHTHRSSDRWVWWWRLDITDKWLGVVLGVCVCVNRGVLFKVVL